MLKRIILIFCAYLCSCSKLPYQELYSGPGGVGGTPLLYKRIWNRIQKDMLEFAELHPDGSLFCSDFLISNPAMRWYNERQIEIDGATTSRLSVWLADAANNTTVSPASTPDGFFIEYGGVDPASQKEVVLYQWLSADDRNSAKVVFRNSSQYAANLIDLMNYILPRSWCLVY